MTVCWYKETAIDSVVKTILFNVVNFNLVFYQYHHSDYGFNQFYLMLIFNIVKCFHWKL